MRLFVCFSTALLQILALEHASIETTSDPFPDDILTPYKDYYKTKRTHRHVRECQHILYGNRTHETLKILSRIKPGQPFVQVKNFYHRYTRNNVETDVVGHVVSIEDPFRTFSVLEPREVGGCSDPYKRATVAESAKQRKCWVATNAGFFRTNDGKCYGNVFSDGRKVQDSGGVQNANFGIRRDGSILVGYLSEEMVDDKENPFVQLVSGVIWILRNGTVYINESKTAECRDTEETGSMDLFADVMSARTALGHDIEGRVMIVQIDGKTNHRGIDLYSFASLLLKLGLVNAINLDGGGSATMVVNNTLVNYPSDECGLFTCSRKVSTVVCAHEPDCIPKDCNGHGQCVMGECLCNSHWTGGSCNVLKCRQHNCSSNGNCTTEDGCSCFPGWKGEKCNEGCASGFFGLNCSRECLCQNGGTCDPVDGHCTCTLGWMGTFCQQRCFHGSYGQNCMKICKCPDTCDCHPVTGECSSASNHSMLNSTQRWLHCELDLKMKGVSTKETVLQSNTEKGAVTEEEFSKFFVWFVAVISLCAVSLLANLFLIYLACNQATKKAVSFNGNRKHERLHLFNDDDDDEDAL